MKTFSIKFKVGSLELDAIVTVSDRHQKFKVEMVTGEPDPILLRRSVTGEWSIENAGARALSAEQFKELQQVIENELSKFYSSGKILVLTDFSESSFNAARYAASLTKQIGASVLTLYHSYDYVPVATTPFALIPPEQAHSEKESYVKLGKLKESLEQLVAEDTVIELISDCRTLISAVNTITEQQQIALLVMGMDGKGEIEKVITGSNTITIANECRIPLLVVPYQAKFNPIKNILFACDLKNVTKTVPVYPINVLVEAIKAQFSILFVNKTDEKTHSGAATELENLHQIWNEHDVKYYYTDHEKIENAIIDFADEHQMDLLITVPKEYGFFERIFHRSLTRNLAYRTHIPLLVFKEEI